MDYHLLECVSYGLPLCLLSYAQCDLIGMIDIVQDELSSSV